MLSKFWKTYWYFFASSIVVTFGLKKQFKKLYLCGNSLKKITYRLPEKSKRDYFITFRVYKNILYQITHKRKPIARLEGDCNDAIFDVGIDNSNLRYNYVKYFSLSKPKLLISKSELLHFIGVLPLMMIVFLLLFSFLPVFILSIISRRKFHFPLLIQEMVECFYLSMLLSKNKITKVHYFCIYERDANLCAFILMKQGIFINKIPSEVPLFFLNKTLIASQLSCCFAYQKEEYEAYKETIFVDKVELWAPEKILFAPNRFLHKERRLKKPLYDLGFFSSGNWLRYEIGDVDLGHDDKVNEELILHILVEYARKNSIKLKVFLHPLERKDSHKKLTLRYYASILREEKVSLADESIPSIEGFDDVNIGVSLYSTLMFERIYLGFKTILAPFGYDDFPIESSGLKNVCINNEKELVKKLNASLIMTSKEFFSENSLGNYSEYI